MDKAGLGQRLAEARDLAGMTQESVAREVGLDRTAIVLLEKGQRNLKVPELVAIAEVLGRPFSYFVEEPVPAAVSRRSAPHDVHGSTRALDVELDQFSTDLRGLLQLGLVTPPNRDARLRVPRTHDEAESTALAIREKAGLGFRPVDDLGRLCEAYGLYTFAIDFGGTGPDGACVEVESINGTACAAVINGAVDAGRRRMTLAHELGHWLFGDAYDAQANLDSERMINSFAIHFLAPRAGIQYVWSDNSERSDFDRALTAGVAFRLSWSATISHLRNLGFITHQERDQLDTHKPRSGDYLRLGLSWNDELAAPYLSPAFIAACLTGYTSAKLTESRVLELLRGMLSVDDLPELDAPSMETLHESFEGHGSSEPNG